MFGDIQEENRLDLIMRILQVQISLRILQWRMRGGRVGSSLLSQVNDTVSAKIEYPKHCLYIYHNDK